MNGVLCISLDTEFFWGVHDTAPASYVENVRQARKTVIPTCHLGGGWCGILQDKGIADARASSRERTSHL